MSKQDLTGQTLGTYKLVEILGRGGMGTVYRAYQESLNREVAVKILAPEMASHPDYLERFNREARTAASLEHAHIVPVYDFGAQMGLSYVVMRLLTGGSLADRIVQREKNNASLPGLKETSELLSQLSNALDYAHSQGIIHRDIKPGNVMFDNHGSPYLMDFGIAKLMQVTRSLTGTGMAVGTPAYMPPEQWRADEVTPATDQYAMGVLVYLLLTGKLPFEAPTLYGLMNKHLHKEPSAVHELRAELPEQINGVIARAMAKRPSDRFPNMRGFASAFEQVAQSFSTASTGFFKMSRAEEQTETTLNQVEAAPPNHYLAGTPAYTPPSSYMPSTPLPPPGSSPLAYAPPYSPPPTYPTERRLWLGAGACSFIVILGLTLGTIFLLSKRDSDKPPLTIDHVATNQTQTAIAVAVVPTEVVVTEEMVTETVAIAETEIAVLATEETVEIVETEMAVAATEEVALATEAVVIPQTETVAPPTATLSPTPVPPTATWTATFTATWTATFTPTYTTTATSSPTQRPSDTPTATWTLIPSPTDTQTSTSTPSPTPTRAVVSPPKRATATPAPPTATTRPPTKTSVPPTPVKTLPNGSPDQVVQALFNYGDVASFTGNLVNQTDRLMLDLSQDDNTIQAAQFGGKSRFDAFVLSATVEWPQGSNEDFCGFSIGYEDDSNFSFVILDRAHTMKFGRLDNNQWTEFEEGAQTDGASSHQIVLMSDGSRITVYVDNIFFDTYLKTVPRGDVRAVMYTGTNSSSTTCTFRDYWLWDLDAITPQITTIQSGVNIRIGPGTDFAVLGTATGRSYSVIGRDNSRQWLQILYNNQPGWVRVDLTSGVPNASALPIRE